MAQVDLGWMAQASGREDVFLSGVTDIEIMFGPAGPVIYTATGGGGAGMASFSTANGLAQRIDFAVFPGGAQIGQSTTITPLDLGAAQVIAATGINGAGLWAYDVASAGMLSNTGRAPGETALPPGLSVIHSQDVAGTAYVFGADAQGNISVWAVTNAGQLAARHSLPTEPGRITAMAGLHLDGQDFLITTSTGANAVTYYRLDATGLPVLANTVPVADGMGIASPSALQVVQMGAQSYAIVASRTSNTLSVFEIGPDGALNPIDHLIDNLQTRFGGAAYLEAVTIGDAIYVAAAGDEDGLSLFQLLPGGRLLHLTTFADSPDTTLADVAAFAMAADTDRIVLTVASESEPGLTIIESGPAGQSLVSGGTTGTLMGGAGDDILAGSADEELLTGGAGDDILMDGAGADTMEGGAGADIFVMANDGTPDTILGFQPGLDRLDLSNWAFLRNTGQLQVHELPDGAEITFGNERLRIVTETYTTLSAATIAQMPLLDVDRMLPDWFGPTPIGGGTEDDTLTGSLADDSIAGGSGNDELFARAGNDILDGGAGADLLNGGPGSDIFIVDNTGDVVVESRKWLGHDTVRSSVDFRMGRKHIEDLELTGDAVLGAGNGLKNRITGNDADNVLDGGKNVDTLVGGLGNDTYLVRAPGDNAVELAGEGMDTVKAFRAYALDANIERLFLQTLRNAAGEGVAGVNGIGNDLDNTIVGNPFDNVIIGREGRDTLKGQAGADTFVFDRAIGADNVDRIIDFNIANGPSEGDMLKFKGTLFGGLKAGALDEDAFYVGNTAADVNDRFIYDYATGELWFDPDGTGTASQDLVATFEQDAILAFDDFLIF